MPLFAASRRLLVLVSATLRGRLRDFEIASLKPGGCCRARRRRSRSSKLLTANPTPRPIVRNELEVL